MVIVIADKTGKALREIADYSLEVAFGEDENTITITADADVMPPNGGYAYIDGTEYGGTIDKIKSGTANNTLSGLGRSWHGVLAGKRIVPASGQSHVVVSGQVATVLQQIVDMVGLDDLFEAPSTESDSVAISGYQFERFVDAYTGLKALCLAYGLKLTMRFASNKVLLGAKAVVDYGSKVDSDLLDFDITVTSRCTNHLICGGTGENENRAIIHFYADAEGNVSHTQTFFGIDEIVGFYDYSNASEEQLEEDGKKKLEELQTEGEVQVSVHDDLDIDVGDIVTGRDNRTGMIVSAPITKKIVKVDRGVATYSYEAGTPSSGTSASTISGSAESTNGGHAYYAGNGLTLDNYTFNADVDAADLQAVNETASNALTQASNALSTASAAQQTAEAAVATISASSPITARRDDKAVSLSHANSGVSAGAYGAIDNATADWGDIVTVGARVSVNATGHVTSAQGRTVTLPGNTATQDAKGLMSAADKTKLDGVEEDANNTVVDDELSSTSTNPVQNKVVKGALDDKANSEHNHSASNITSGTLPVARGGTGASNVARARTNLLSNISDNPEAVNDNTRFLITNVSNTGNILRNSASSLWTWIKGKADSIYAAVNHTHETDDITGLQSELDGKANSSHTHAATQITGLTASRALATNSSGQVVVSAVTNTELSYLDGVTSAVQTQLNNKAAKTHTHNYAGSSSPGGAATSSNKLATARTITLTGAVNGSAEFDGSKNITITTTGDSEAASFLAAYPVGAIYHTTKSDNPSTVYGGTWKALPSVEGFKWERTA